MTGSTRDRVSIDLRGIGGAVRAAASGQGLGVAQWVRHAVVERLDPQTLAEVPSGSDRQTACKTIAKLTLRLPAPHAEALMANARALGLSYGDYVARLVSGVRLPLPSAERAADRAALLAACDHLAALSTDLNAVVRLLSAGKRAQAEPYRERFVSADAAIKRQLDRMAKFLEAL